MIMLAVSGYLVSYVPGIAKKIWLAGIIIHAIHICYFTYQSVIKEFSWETFMPSWFVTYNGIMVATVVGVPMNEPLISKFIVYYGIVIMLPKFFALPFTPGYAGLTFPMAIGIVASVKMTGVLKEAGQETASRILTELTGFQFYLTTMIIGYVLLRFIMVLLRVKEPEMKG